MFYGEYSHSLASKGRVIIPAKFREVVKEHFADKFYITRGLDRCLFIFTEEAWKSQERKFRELSFTKSEARKFNRLYFSGACDSVCDKQGRILIPDYLKQYAEIQEEVVIIGVSDRIEIWAKEKWKEFFKDHQGSFEELAEKLMTDKEKE